jgi:hypothetical protein
MCNTCVKAVHSLSKSRGHEHNLCATSLPTGEQHGQNHLYSTVFTQINTHCLSTRFISVLHLLKRGFPTVYTAPITNTPKYI